jgi:antitoxin component YwqK of YwqJK toxin-antitoxin module
MIGEMKRITICLLLILFGPAVIQAEVTRKEMINPDGTVEHVFYCDGKKIAKQKLDDNGNIIQTISKIPNGVVRGYYESGKLEYECNYRDNKLEGIVKVYYESGKLMKEWNYKDNKLNGITKWYFENGKLMRQFNYKDGKREGISKKFYENGGIWSIKTYKNGKFVNRKEYDKEGKLQSEWNYLIEEKENKR